MKHRKWILGLALGSGLIAVLGTILFAIAGAGIFGSPFSGDAYFNATLLLVLVCGPLAVLPCAIIDIFKPGWGGLVLCGLALLEVMMVALNNMREWGFAVHDAALGSLCLALPMFLIGSLLFFSSLHRSRWALQTWRLLAISVAGFCFWQVGSDGIEALLQVLRGGTI